MNTPDIDYEQQQIQQIIQTQIAQQKEKERVVLLSIQKAEYEQALQQDLQKELRAGAEHEPEPGAEPEAEPEPEPEPEAELEFEEPSLEEVRRVRLLRFEKTESKQLKQ